MLDRIRNAACSPPTKLLLLAVAASALASCATKQPPPLVSDNAGGRESSLPWNEQQKWEQSGNLGPAANLQTR